MERHYILQQRLKSSPDTDQPPPDAEHDPHYPTRPPRYRNVHLPQDWYIVGRNRKKRSDHETHGVISFNELSKLISTAWAEADDETKAYCKMISSSELEKYHLEKERYKEKYGEEAFESQTLKRKNEELAKELVEKGVDRKNEKKRLKMEKMLKKMKKEEGASAANSPERKQNEGDRKSEEANIQQNVSNSQGATLQDSSSNQQTLISSAVDRNTALQLARAREERLLALAASQGLLNDDIFGIASHDELLRAKLAMQDRMTGYSSDLARRVRTSALLAQQTDRNRTLLSPQEGIERQTSITSRDAQLREMLARQSERIEALTRNALGGLTTQDTVQRSVPSPRHDLPGENDGIITMLRNQRERLQTMMEQNDRLQLLATSLGGTPSHQNVVRSSAVELNNAVDREDKFQTTITTHFDRLKALQNAQEDRLLLTRLQENHLRNLASRVGLGGSLAASLDTHDIYQPEVLSQILPHIHEASSAATSLESSSERLRYLNMLQSPSAQRSNRSAASLRSDPTQSTGAGFCQPTQTELETSSSKKDTEHDDA